ncbi:MAG: hypothetical protein J0G99_10895 [Alphaproteobacteria bacterium]|nr:hypothetical protein [Alphaproteobacteria bacterium]
MKKTIVFMLAMACAGCAAGPDGNPDNTPYANQPGGTIAVAPQDSGRSTYDPYAPNPSADTSLGAPALGSNGGAPMPDSPSAMPPR